MVLQIEHAVNKRWLGFLFFREICIEECAPICDVVLMFSDDVIY